MRISKRKLKQIIREEVRNATGGRSRGRRRRGMLREGYGSFSEWKLSTFTREELNEAIQHLRSPDDFDMQVALVANAAVDHKGNRNPWYGGPLVHKAVADGGWSDVVVYANERGNLFVTMPGINGWVLYSSEQFSNARQKAEEAAQAIATEEADEHLYRRFGIYPENTIMGELRVALFDARRQQI